MDMIAFASFKGGAGKTTALMCTASCLLDQNKKIALFEADDNKPISQWKANALAKGTWNDNCLVFIANNETDFEKAYVEAEEAGCDYALIDTQGGGSELNTFVLVNSDMIVIPTALTVLDVDETVETFKYAVQVALAAETEVPTKILKTRLPNAKLTLAQKRTSDLLEELPCLTTGLQSRNAFEDMKFKGLLHQTYKKMQANPNDALIAGNYKKAIEEAEAVTMGIMNSIEAEADAA